MNGERFRDGQRGGDAPARGDGDGALVRRPIDPQRLLAAVASPEAGANVLFVGTARNQSAGGACSGLDYEAHEPMAGPALERLCAAAVERFGLAACALEHRLGRIAVGDLSVAVAASAAHRRDAFAAAEWLMERIKREVPIWKCEERVDGRREWIHPEPRQDGGGDRGPVGGPREGAGPREGERRGDGRGRRRGGRGRGGR